MYERDRRRWLARRRWRLGTDYATRDAQGRPTTGLPVYAVTDAVVAEIGWDPERSGLWLALVDDDGWRYSYAHLSVALAAEGQRVRCGEQIALSGHQVGGGVALGGGAVAAADALELPRRRRWGAR